jgi:hypothetical protein
VYAKLGPPAILPLEEAGAELAAMGDFAHRGVTVITRF